MKPAAPKKSGASKKRTPEKTSFEKAVAKHGAILVANPVIENLTSAQVEDKKETDPDEYEIRLDALHERWRHPNDYPALTKSQEQELINAGRIKDQRNVIPGENLPAFCGAKELQKILQAKFPACGHNFDRQTLQHWKKGYPENRMSNPEIPPFPKTEGQNNYNVKACIDWVQRWIVELGNKLNGGGIIAGSKTDQLKDLALEEGRFDLEIKKGHWVSRKEAEISGIGIIKRFQAITRDEIRAEFIKDDIARGERLIDALEIKYADAGKDESEPDQP
jgi:hypothetical protein